MLVLDLVAALRREIPGLGTRKLHLPLTGVIHPVFFKSLTTSGKLGISCDGNAACYPRILIASLFVLTNLFRKLLLSIFFLK